MSKILSVKAREVIDSRANPTIECEIKTREGVFSAMVPSGASTGIYEALELRDGGKRFNGKGVLKAVKIINKKIAPKIIGKNARNQKELDELMIKLDNTPNKSKLGANSILAVSMAISRAGAKSKKTSLYKHINTLTKRKMVLPVPCLNVINGGEHAGNELAFQEFMLMPISAKNYSQGILWGIETYNELKKIIKKKYGVNAINVGDEGGFAPNIKNAFEGLKILNKAISNAGYEGKIKIGLDVAASEFFVKTKNLYDLGIKQKKRNYFTSEKLINYYEKMVNEYEVISIEDPFDQDDWASHTELVKRIGKRVQIVGDDLLVTNVNKIRVGVEKKAVNALLLKVNQIGSVTESINAFELAKKNDWGVMVSHRSGETEDSFIADLAVGLGSGQIKSGAPSRSERLAKYNQLLRIEEELGKKAVYAGKKFRTI